MTLPGAGGTRIALDPRLLDMLRQRLPAVATHTISAVTEEVPSYAGAFGGPMGDNIENAVQMALAGFLRLAARGRTTDAGTPLSPRGRAPTRWGAERRAASAVRTRCCRRTGSAPGSPGASWRRPRWRAA